MYCEKQKEFFEKGVSRLRPLRLKDVAMELSLHESTISRVTTDKYMETGHGIFELKYFFSGTLQEDNEKAASTTSTKAKIAEIIKNENSKEPLPDHEIAEIMKEHGTNIARRTVAKYREQLSILPVQLRKQY